MIDEAKNRALAQKFQQPEFNRWVDLTPAGMRLQIAIYGGGLARLVVENGDKMPEAMTALGFTKAGGGYWYNDDLNYLPNKFKKLIAGADIVRQHPISEIILDLTETAENDKKKDLQELSRQLEDNAPVFIGYNSTSQPVFMNKDGSRHTVHDGKTIFEGAGASPAPGRWLRAFDDNTLKTCADGFIVTARSAPNDAAAHPSQFLENIGLKSTDMQRFVDAVAAAASRQITKASGDTLAARFASAVEIGKALSAVGMRIPTHPSHVIISRRLLGLDRELRGDGYLRFGDPDSYFKRLMPTSGVREVTETSEATVVVGFAKSAPEAASLLDGCAIRTRGVFMIDVDSARKARAVVSALAKANSIEGAAFFGEGAGGPKLALSLVVTGQPSSDYDFQEIASEAEAWTWASTVAAERNHAIENMKAGLATESDFTSASAHIVDNTYQVPYSSASRLGEPTTLMPKELSAATRVALDRLISNYGDVDQKVAYECGYSREDLGKYFAPEQVDGIAMVINAEERDRGAVIGDGAGVGKGRQIMALVRRAVLKGERCVIFSEAAANLADLLRDAKHINSLADVKPLVVNDDELFDEDTKQPFETHDRSILDKAITDNEWPEGVNVIMLSYSQINREAKESTKVAWLREIVDERVNLFGDEIHNAASLDSNISKNYAYLKSQASKKVSASATHAKEPKNIAFFNELFPGDMNLDELQDMMIKGGEPFQEVVSDMLAADGVFFRRETDLSAIEFSQHVDIARLPENRANADRLSVIVAEMATIVDALNAAGGDEERQRRRHRASGIGSSLYFVTRLFNAAILAPYAAEQAIEDLKAGEKPGFLVDNTIAALLEEFKGGDTQPNFRHVLTRMLTQHVVRDGETHEATRARLEGLQEGMGQRYDDIVDLIGQFPEIPASVIDIIKNKIKAAGYTIGEITGRTLEINEEGRVVPRKERNRSVIKNAYNSGDYDAIVMNASGSTGMDFHAGRRFKDRRRRVLYEVQSPSNVIKQIQAYGRYSRRDQESAPKIKFLSSGLPFESRISAMRNQKLRRLSANIQSNRDNTFLMGNIPDLLNSVGDVVITKYAEMRPDLLRRLVLSDRYSERTKLVEVADEVAVFQEQPEKATELMVIDQPVEGQRNGNPRRRQEAQFDQHRSGNEFLSRLSLLPCKEQERILHELTAEYEMHIAELDSLGLNPLRPREFDGTVNVKGSKLFEGSIESGANSAFDAPMFLMEAVVEREVEPMKSDVLVESLESATPRYETILATVKEVYRNRERYLSHYLKDGHLSIDDAIAKGDAKIASMAKDIDHLMQAVEAFIPGREIVFYNADGVAEKAIIASLEAPWQGSEHLMASYRMKIAIPGTEKLKEYGLETVLRNDGVSSFDKDGSLVIRTQDGVLGNDYDKVLESFDNARRRRTEGASFLVGNVFRAVRYATQFKLGSLVSFVDEKGYRHRGVHINKRAERRLNDIAFRIESMDVAAVALAKGIQINSSPTGTGKNLVITPLNNGTFAVQLPEPNRRKNVKLWPSEDYRRLFEMMGIPDFDRENAERENMSKSKIKAATAPRLVVREGEQLDNVLRIVADAGFNTFFVAPKYKKELGFDDREATASWDREASVAAMAAKV